MAVDMAAQTEDMEAEIHTAAAVRAPHTAAMAAARTLTADTAVEAPLQVTAKESLPMERTNPTPLTALSQALVAMAALVARDHHILVVTATAAMERAPLQPTEAKERTQATAVPAASHHLAATEAPRQDMARHLATARTLATARPLVTARPLAMETPHQATARAPAPATARAPAPATAAPL
jgi:hypothetical protein